MAQLSSVKIDLGGGLNCPAGYVAVDRVGGDVTVDLEDGHLPFDTDSVAEIRAHHILEHITALIPLMNECHRVLCPEGMMCIEVPRYPSFTCFVDPTHVRVFTDVTFEYFTKALSYFNYGMLPWVIERKETTPDFLRVRMRPDTVRPEVGPDV